MRPKILLSSVFKPFAVDNMYSRSESIHELCRNQLTKVQGLFSIRTYHNTYGIHTIAANIDVPVNVLDFPTLNRFRRELKKDYDIVGIGSIMPNFQKVKKMVEVTREVAPRSKIVIGGFCAAIPDLDKVMDVDYVCVGEGISFMRNLLGLPEEFKFNNPNVFAENREIFGVPLFGIQQNPHVIVGLGCSYGCDFCSPSYFFGKRHIKFYTSGRELFNEIQRVEKKYRTNIIVLIGDDNFLLDLQRAEELRQCVVESGKVYKLFIFGSANKVVEFGVEKLAEMGVETLWIGRESKFADYSKNEGINITELVGKLRSYGIKVILSSILLLDQHTKKNIEIDIEEHLEARPVLSQFAHYSPAPNTPLYTRMKEEGRLLTSIPYEEWHAFKQPWYIHPEFTLKEGEDIQQHAYMRDFLELGPSVLRYADVEYQGWLNLKDSPKPHLRARAEAAAKEMWKYRIIAMATDHLAPSDEVRRLSRELLEKIEKSFGRANAIEKAMARTLQLTGSIWKFRNRHWGDARQPRTRLVKYNY